MKILILGPCNFPYGGAAARCVHMLGKGLVKLGHEITVLVPEKIRPAIKEIDGIKVICCHVVEEETKHPKASKLLTQILFFLECLKQTITSVHHDWIIIYGLSFVGGFLAPIWRLCGNNVTNIQTDIFFKNLVFKKWGIIFGRIYELLTMKSSFYFSSVFFTVSSGLENYYKKMAPKKKIIRFVPPVDCELFANPKNQPLVNYTSKKDEKLIVFSGGFSDIEGAEILLKAFASSLKRIKNSELRLVLASALPPKDQLDKLETLMNSLAVKEKVLIVKGLTLSGVIDLLLQADMLVMPKIDHIVNQMAMPIKLGEYLASGRPVITTAVSDIGQYLKHKENALLCKPGDVESLAECIILLSEDRQLAENIGREGRILAKTIFDIIPNAEKISKGLQEMADKRSAAKRIERR